MDCAVSMVRHAVLRLAQRLSTMESFGIDFLICWVRVVQEWPH